VLQERELERVGGNTTITVDVRVIAATNRDLRELVRTGRFRSDLYFRLDVVPLVVPRLAARRADIPALADHFLRKLEGLWKRKLGKLSEGALTRLSAYDWPGNVRELSNVIERAAISSDGGLIEVPPELLAFFEPGSADSPRASADATAPEPQTREEVRTLADVERAHITRALEQTRWRLAGPDGAGALLGMHPNTLRHRMKKLRIER